MTSQDTAAVIALPSVDEPYTFGRTPHAVAPFPFTERQFAHLLIIRGRAQEGTYQDDGRYASTQYAA